MTQQPDINQTDAPSTSGADGSPLAAVPTDGEPSPTDAPPPPVAAPANPLLRKRQYSFPAAETDKLLAAALLQKGKSTNLKGFRPGKAPLRMLHQLFGKETLQDILIRQAGQRFETDVREEKEPLASSPHYAPASIAANDVYHVDCHYETLPDISPPAFADDGSPSDDKLKTPTLSVGEKEIDEMTEILREQNGRYIPHTSGAVDGCRLLVEMETDGGGADAKPEKTGVRQIRLGAPTLLPEINQALNGAVDGDIRTARPLMPDNHPDESLRGKHVEIKITVNSVEKLQKAELNEEFFTALGTETGGGLPAFRKMVDAHLRREVAVRLRNLRRRRALDKLIEKTPPFALPQTLVYDENINLLRGAQAHWEQRGGQQIAASLTLETFFPEAQRRVRLGLILSNWQRLNKPEISDEQLNARLDEIAESYEMPEQKKTEIRANPRQIEAARLSVLEDIIVEWVYSHVAAEAETLTLSQLLKDPTGDTENAA